MWLIIGYGNSLNSDDGFGIAVAEAVLAMGNNNLKVITAHQLTPEFMEPIAEATGVIFVDVHQNLPPGQFERLEILLTESELVTSKTLSHHCTPAQLIQGSYAIYGHAPRAWLYSVGGENYEFGEKLSETVSAMVPHVVSAIISHSAS